MGIWTSLGTKEKRPKRLLWASIISCFSHVVTVNETCKLIHNSINQTYFDRKVFTYTDSGTPFFPGILLCSWFTENSPFWCVWARATAELPDSRSKMFPSSG